MGGDLVAVIGPIFSLRYNEVKSWAYVAVQSGVPVVSFNVGEDIGRVVEVPGQ